MRKTLSLSTLFLSLFFLAGCWNTTVIEEKERVLPETSEEFSRENIDVDYSKSYLAFKGNLGGIMQHEGKFNDYTVTITLNENSPTDLEKASVSVEIDLTSMETDSDGLTNHLSSADFFDVENFPTAIFTSTSITKKADNMYTVTGDLTLKDVTKGITMEAEITDDYALMTYTMNRLDFNVGVEGDKPDAEVPLEIKLMFQ